MYFAPLFHGELTMDANLIAMPRLSTAREGPGESDIIAMKVEEEISEDMQTTSSGVDDAPAIVSLRALFSLPTMEQLL